MANSLHYVKNKLPFLKRVQSLLNDTARLILVEYDISQPNQWVPYPLSFDDLKQLSEDAGFVNLEKLSEHPSVYQRGNIYSAKLQRD